MKDPMIVKRLELARAAWRRGVRMRVIIEDGWARGLRFEQTLMECSAAGYGMCVAGPEIRRIWAWWNESYLRACREARGPAELGSFMAFNSKEPPSWTSPTSTNSPSA